MRPGAQLALNEGPIKYRSDLTSLAEVLEHVSKRGQATPLESFAAQDSSKSYILYFPDPKKDKWKITYRQLTRQGYEEAAAAKTSLRRPSRQRSRIIAFWQMREERRSI